VDTKPGYKKLEEPNISYLEMAKLAAKKIDERKKTLEDHIQDIKDLTIRNGGHIKTLERYETGGKLSSIELTLSFKVH
jgi:hypothetical protein